MSIVRKDPIRKSNSGGTFARGKRSIAICERSGMKRLRDEMVFEPGTNYIVHRSESDKDHNLVTDALNFPSEKLQRAERSLKYTSPDVPLSIGVVVSADALYLPTYISVFNQWLVYAQTSVGSGEEPSGVGSFDFSDEDNSIAITLIYGF